MSKDNDPKGKPARVTATALVYSLIQKLGDKATPELIESEAQKVRPKSLGLYKSVVRREFVINEKGVAQLKPSTSGLTMAVRVSAKRKTPHPLIVLFPKEYEQFVSSSSTKKSSR